MKTLLLLVLAGLVILALIGKIGKYNKSRPASESAAAVLARAVRFFFYGFIALAGAFAAYVLLNGLWKEIGS